MAEIEKVIFMNMCMVYDHAGRVLALDKVGKSYSGTTFPGGHVEMSDFCTRRMSIRGNLYLQKRAKCTGYREKSSCENCLHQEWNRCGR